MKTGVQPEVARAINEQAHMLAQQYFVPVRTAIRQKVADMLKGGASTAEVVKAIQQFGLGRPPAA